MDRNQVIGIVLIAVILIGYSIFSSPSKEEIEKARREKIINDSLAKIEQAESLKNSQQLVIQDSAKKAEIGPVDSLKSDSASLNKIKDAVGAFSQNAIGENKFITLENDLIKLTISTRGGRPYALQLKNYNRYDSLPVVLFNGDENIFDINFFADKYNISTSKLFFTPVEKDSVIIAKNGKKSVRMRINAEQDKYVEFIYSIEPGKYLVDFDIKFVNLDQMLQANMGSFDLNWNIKGPSIEKGKNWEDRYTSVYYKIYNGNVDYLSQTSAKDENSDNIPLKWVAFKQQFFSSILIAKEDFKNKKLSQARIESDPKFVKNFNALLSVPLKNTVSFAFYFGPNQYKILNKVELKEKEDLNLTKLIPLGWAIFGWINRFAIIPLFNWLGSFISNYGLIILLMTIIIKLVLFPLTYKSYISSAKMRVLKPQIDEINAKIPKEKTMERQQATMALYKKAGVNPMGGCLPMLLQFPILIAMYMFFPASIELRQKAFLWTNDLSSYDSILDFTFNIPFYGNHISLFTLLMAISMIAQTKISSDQMQGANAQMPGMKMMMYLMPVMMLFWFNNYSSGLSYYYFLTNIITIGQTLIIRRFVDDEEVLKKLNENKKKPVTKSKFQQRLEDMAKQRANVQKKRK